MARPKRDDTFIVEAALMGLQHQHSTITESIAEIRKQLGIRGVRDGASGEPQQPQRKRRRMSPAARKRIADARKKRWAAWRKGRTASK